MPIALAMLAPVLTHILAFHLFLEPQGLAMAGFLVACEACLVWAYWPHLRSVVGMNAKPRTA